MIVSITEDAEQLRRSQTGETDSCICLNRCKVSSLHRRMYTLLLLKRPLRTPLGSGHETGTLAGIARLSRAEPPIEQSTPPRAFYGLLHRVLSLTETCGIRAEECVHIVFVEIIHIKRRPPAR